MTRFLNFRRAPGEALQLAVPTTRTLSYTVSHRPALARMQSACTALLQRLLWAICTNCSFPSSYNQLLVTSMAFFPSSSGFIINGGNFTNFNFQTDLEDSGQSMSI